MPEQAEPEKAATNTAQAFFDFPEMGTEQTSFFGNIGTEPQPVDMAPVPRGLPYPQEIIDAALSVGANDLSSRKRITAYFMKDKSLMDNAIFLRDQYGTNGAGFYVRDTQYAIWYDASGIRLSMGESAMGSGAYMITWEQAAKRIRELLDEGRYIPQSELNDAADFELRETAERLVFMYRDIDNEYRGLHLVPTIAEADSKSNDYSEKTEKMVELLRQPDKLHNLSEEMQAFMTAYTENRAILRFRYHLVRQLVTKLNDLQRKPLTFTAAPDYDSQRRFFISADEMDNLLREHKDNHDYRLGVYSFFLAHTDSKEREQYMKSIHGEYNGSYSGNNNILYTHKSVSYSHGVIGNPYASVEWKWNKATRRIGELIQANRFLTDEDRAAMPDYERNQVARQIVSAMAGAPDYIPRPFTGNPFTDYSQNVKQVQAQLTDPERVQAIHDSLLTLFEMTLPDDRHYDVRSEALDIVKAYQQGEFSLFGEKREPVLVQDNSAPEPAGKPETAEASAALEQEAKEQKTQRQSRKTKPAENYKLGFGHMGNGLVVWNSLEYEHGDYKTVAHIAADRTVKFYDDEMPESVRKIIIEEAETSDDRVSVTQNDPVFSTPPRERTLRPPAEEVQHQPEQPPVNTDGQAPIQTSAVSEEHAEASSPQARQTPASSPRTIAQEDIDEALREWNGSIESKRAVMAYMREHGREREAAAWLRQECGDDMPAFPVHGVVGTEGDISWTRVQRGILRLIHEDRFFTEEEKKKNLSLEKGPETNSEEKDLETNGEEKEPEISAPSSDAAATPCPAEFVTPGGFHYHVGDTFQYTKPDGSVS